MKIDRQEFLQELKLREQLRKAIRFIKARNTKKYQTILDEEVKLRNIIRKLLKEAEVEDVGAGDESTAIVKLRELLKLIVPEYETGYTSLKTALEQRESYRTHILNAVQDILVRADVNFSAKADIDPGETPIGIEEEISVSVGEDAPEREKFLQGVREKPEEEPEEEETPEEKEFEEFAIAGQDRTGAVEAHESMKQTENQIMQAYARLYNSEDRDIFADYLITNLQLHFDDFEEEMEQMPPEPESPEYEKIKSGEEEAAIEPPEAGLMDEDEDPF